MSNKQHPFHLVDPSPWPVLTSLAVFILGTGFVLLMQKMDKITFFIGCIMLLGVLFCWWRDVFREGDHDKAHTPEVKFGLKLGMVLFIVSEIMLFISLFWSYFNFSLFPSEVGGGIWPPEGIKTLDPFELPYLNTLLLLLSGSTLTWAHHGLHENDYKSVLQGLGLTIALGAIFTVVQIYEYAHALFTIDQGVYPSNFYLATGFHGAHVILGTIFLSVCFMRALKGKLAKEDLSFEMAAWYWHFVDVVWLLLFISIYIGGSN